MSEEIREETREELLGETEEILSVRVTRYRSFAPYAVLVKAVVPERKIGDYALILQFETPPVAGPQPDPIVIPQPGPFPSDEEELEAVASRVLDEWEKAAAFENFKELWERFHPGQTYPTEEGEDGVPEDFHAEMLAWQPIKVEAGGVVTEYAVHLFQSEDGKWERLEANAKGSRENAYSGSYKSGTWGEERMEEWIAEMTGGSVVAED